jgi:MSHA biogenesis protein MshO
MRPTSNRRLPRRGFTLVELIAVMSITAIVAAMVAVFIRLPMQAYQDIQRRADISDAADTVFSQIKRDLQTALPNSIRVTTAAGITYLEFLPVRTSGRYRADVPVPAVPSSANTCPDTDGNTVANENVFQFGVSDTCMTTIGALPNFGSIVANSDYLVVYNLGIGFTNANVYESGAATGGNKSLITATAAGVGGENVVRFTAHTFNLDSPGRRFQIVSGPVTYVCDPTPGAPTFGTVRRITGYAIAAAQPTPPVGASAQLAQNITACTITYNQNVINQRAGIVAIALTFADSAGGTAVNLFQQVQVSNVP